MQKHFIAVTAFVALSNAMAQNILTYTPTQNKKSNFTGYMGFQHNQIVENVGEVTGNEYISELEMTYENKKDSSLERKFQFASQLNSESQMMFSVPEAKLKHNFTNADLTYGRQILDWSDVDAMWGFGKLNNRKNFNFFEPAQEGLTGISFGYKFGGGFKVTGFGSFLYVPEMNPSTTINKEEGTITCENPWCTAPSATTTYAGKEVPIRYNVEYPEISDVVLRYSTGLNLGFENKYFETNAFYMRKPENSPSVTAELSFGLEDVDSGKEDEIIVDITPQFYYHDVVGTNLKLKAGDFEVYGSAISIVPNEYPDGDRVVYQYTGIEPEKFREDYAGGGVAYKTEKQGIGLNYVARVSEFNRTNDILAVEPRWNQAWNVNLYRNWTRRFSTAFDIKQDMITEDRLVMFRANYSVSSDMMVAIGVNSIGAPSDTSFWSDYDNNDAVYGSLRYVF
jgi:hypothetical protein